MKQQDNDKYRKYRDGDDVVKRCHGNYFIISDHPRVDITNIYPRVVINNKIFPVEFLRHVISASALPALVVIQLLYLLLPPPSLVSSGSLPTLIG